jgi:hypothetical protein
VPTAAQLGGDFSAQLTTTALGTDCLGRTIYQGAIYNPYSLSNCPGGGQVRDPYPGNIIPTSGPGAIDTLANKFATGNYWPAPKNAGGQFNFNTTASAATTSNEWGIRIDHNINANNRIYGQFSNKHEGKVQTPAFYGNDVAGPYVFDPNNRMFGVLGYSHVFSPTLVLSGELFFIRNPGGNVVQGYPVQTIHARAASPTRCLDSTISAGSVWEHIRREFFLCSLGGDTKLRRSQLPAE